MNSTLLRILAVILAVGAIATAWIGYRISTKSPEAPAKAVKQALSQVVATQDISAGKVLTIDDVKLTPTPQLDPRGYNNVQDVLGKLAVEPIARGTLLTSKHFPALGALAQSLAPNERAIAVKVNEVIGVGGFVKPGDHVDVLLYLRADRETNNVSSAQIVLSNVKVLAYGDLLAEDSESTSQLDVAPKLKGLGTSDAERKAEPKKETKKEKESRSAILAVPDNQVSRLMLAESSGILRLALRGAQPLDSASAENQLNQFIRLNDVVRPVTDKVALTDAALQSSASARTPTKKKTVSAKSKRERVIVHRGEQVEIVNVVK